MLIEIYCEEFHQKRIRFNSGLNVVLGTKTGTNSIGKSTFMLVVDFVFGGNTYSRVEDIIKNVKEHRVCWTFDFGGEKHYFARRVPDSKNVEKCNENYIKVSNMSVSEYGQWLNEQTDLEIDDITFRNAVGRFIRAYGKDNCLEKKPLNSFSTEKDSVASAALLKLFDMYAPISELENLVKESEDAYSTFLKAQRLKLITKIEKKEYNKNLKDINRIENELEDLAETLENNLLEVDSVASEEAIRIKRSLSMAKRYRSRLAGKIATINENLDYEFSPASNTYKELKRFFPSVNLADIEEVEKFHNTISAVFKKEMQEENARIQKEIGEYDIIIASFECQIKELVNNPKLSTIVLKKHADGLNALERMRKENETYEKRTELKKQRDCDRQAYDKIKTQQFDQLSAMINNEMHRINDIIYGGKLNSPVLSFKGNTYSFFTPNDTGTGIAYKGLVVFDLAVLNLTRLPILVHDSVVLKQISDEAIESIMELYVASGKQVVIALDKQDSYSPKTTNLLEDNAILLLGSDEESLFGRSWGRADVK